MPLEFVRQDRTDPRTEAQQDLSGMLRTYRMEDGMIELTHVDSVGVILIDQLAERVVNTFIDSLPESERSSVDAVERHQLESIIFEEVGQKIDAQLEVLRNKRIYQESYAKVQ